ncbi:CaiB/BaiF CoA transferase family protein [Seohaeicola zhoushanensis]|uniref:CoA transferase n=1 Tax=Seohaeicola zhoushanensis TaxID=1569283 RepID=A0A8J3GWP9_9RHOB|nr:CaiB/BaiF CoA-transferase family protein [Seohaeicola zhoushanensis]GHF46430.1 CoA transferase [Seohaeicola zhoushanensis]
MGDLSGILVVSIEQAVAAPYLSGRLAEAGARVIKIERDQGDFARGYDRLVHGESAYFVWLNRGKESVCLDLKSPDDMAILTEMLDRADVFIQNLAPGAADRLGLSPETLRGRNPRLITVTINGYGDTGPYAERKAYDLLVQAESGLSAITGNEAGTARVGVSVCDIATGMTAHQAVLQALFARQRSGQGRHISVSLFHALADWMNVPYLQYAYGGKVAERQGLRHPTIAPYGVFAAADGKEILLSIQNEREWVRLCEQVLDAPALATDPRFASNSDRVANRPELDGIVAETFAQFSRDEIFARLSAADIACGQVSSLADLAEHPQNRYVEADTPSGPVRLLGPGALVDGALPQYGPVPALGQHTDAVRAEFTPHRDEQAG